MTRAPVADASENLSLLVRLFRTPLLTKLIVLDLSVNGLVLLFLQLVPREYTDELTVVSLGVVLVLNAALVAWALQPLAELEATARRVSNGTWDARVQLPAMADRNLVRIADTFNTLLDHAAKERSRVRTLAVRVVDADDRERARIARELHDGTAQALSALDMLLSSTSPNWSTEEAQERLRLLRDITGEALEGVRLLSQTLHPRVLDDMGLEAALEMVVRRASAHPGVEVTLHQQGSVGDLEPLAAATIYRITQEAVHNATKHGGPNIHIHIELERAGAEVHLKVSDDGLGFEATHPEDRSGMGLHVMEERCVLVDARLSITSAPGEGTAVDVWIPLQAAA